MNENKNRELTDPEIAIALLRVAEKALLNGQQEIAELIAAKAEKMLKEVKKK